MIFLIFSFVLSHRFCGVDELGNLVIKVNSTSSKAIQSILPFEPIRIEFDFSYINGSETYPSRCYNAGDLVVFRGIQYTCTDDDILTTQKIQVLKETFSNLKQHLTKIFSVQRETSIQLVSSQESSVYSIPTAVKNKNIYGIDHYFIIYPRPWGSSSTLASCGSFLKERSDGASIRPTHGFVFINVRKIPVHSCDFSDKGNREYFEVLYHEIMHGLGFSNSSFSYWKNPTTKKRYGYDNSLPLTTKPHPNFTSKTISVLHTPIIHRFISERFGIENFFEGMPAGIELENNGGSGTAGSHLEGRVYFSDVMTGTTYGYSRLSAISLKALEDSGWYSINYSYCEPLEYGDYRSIIGQTQPFKDFAVGSPPITFPSHYIFDPTNPKSSDCSYDHRAMSYPSSKIYTRDCSSSSSNQCQYPSFYDPNNSGKYGDETIDYSFIKTPSRICFHSDQNNLGNMAYMGIDFSPESMCAISNLYNKTDYELTSMLSGCYKMQCSTNNELTVYVGNEHKVCSQSNQELQFAGYSGKLICPDPRIICGIKNYELNNNNNYSYPEEPTPVQPTPAEPTPEEPTPIQPTPAEPTPGESSPEGSFSLTPSISPNQTKTGILDSIFSNTENVIKTVIIITGVIIAIIIIVIIIIIVQSVRKCSNKKSKKSKSRKLENI